MAGGRRPRLQRWPARRLGRGQRRAAHPVGRPGRSARIPGRLPRRPRRFTLRAGAGRAEGRPGSSPPWGGRPGSRSRVVSGLALLPDGSYGHAWAELWPGAGFRQTPPSGSSRPRPPCSGWPSGAGAGRSTWSCWRARRGSCQFGPLDDRAHQLTKRYGRFTAVDAIDLDGSEGRAVRFPRPNGAGKTTTLRMIAGILRPTSGTVRIARRRHPGPDRWRPRPHLGFIPDRPFIYDKLTGAEFLRFVAGLYGQDGAGRRAPRSTSCSSCSSWTEWKDELVEATATGCARSSSSRARSCTGPK